MKTLIRLPFLFYQSLVLALGEIWNNKVRAALTMVGIIIGVASVTAVISAMTGLKKKVLADFESMGTNKIYINTFRPETGPMRRVGWFQLRLKPYQFDGMLENCPSLKAVSLQCFYRATVRYGGQSLDRNRVGGIQASWHEVEQRSVSEGRPFSTIDIEQNRAVCLVNKDTIEKLRLPMNPVGQALSIDNRRFTIVGVVEPSRGMAMFGEGAAGGSEVYVPFMLWYNKARFGWIDAVALARSTELNEEAQAEMRSFLRSKRRVRPGDPDTFRLEAIQRTVDQFNSVAQTLQLVAIGIVGISLVVGGVGIMNIMLVSVSERTREIGLRKAVGARPAAILLQFLIEAITVCFMGGLVGVALGYGASVGLSKIPGAGLSQAEVPAWAVAFSFAFSASVGLIFGMFPAIKASRLDPIQALRHD